MSQFPKLGTVVGETGALEPAIHAPTGERAKILTLPTQGSGKYEGRVNQEVVVGGVVYKIIEYLPDNRRGHRFVVYGPQSCPHTGNLVRVNVVELVAEDRFEVPRQLPKLEPLPPAEVEFACAAGLFWTYDRWVPGLISSDPNVVPHVSFFDYQKEISQKGGARGVRFGDRVFNIRYQTKRAWRQVRTTEREEVAVQQYVVEGVGNGPVVGVNLNLSSGQLRRILVFESLDNFTTNNDIQVFSPRPKKRPGY